MNAVANIFSDLRQAVADAILHDPWISTEPAPQVIAEQPGDIAEMIKRELMGRGLTIVVAITDISGGEENDPSRRVVTINVGVGESSQVNRSVTGTQRSAWDTAMVIDGNLNEARVLDPFRPLQFISMAESRSDDGSVVAYDLIYRTSVRVQREEE